MAITENPVVDLQDRGAFIVYIDGGVVIAKSVASPEGLVKAAPGSLLLSGDGNGYLKTTQKVLDIGWSQVQIAAAGQGFEKTLFRNTTAAGTIGTGLDALQTSSFAANTLDITGKLVNVIAEGNYNGALGNKRLVVRFDNVTQLLDTGLQALNNQNWHFQMVISRVLNDAFFTSRLSFTPFGTSGVAPTQFGATVFIPGVNFGASHTIDFLGECANAGDSIDQRLTVLSSL